VESFNILIDVFSAPLILGLFILLLVALITDITFHKISNKLILLGLVVSFILQVMLPEGFGALNWLQGITVGFIGFLPLYLLRAMAAGDVKLMMAVGGFLGYPLILNALLFTIILGGLFAVIFTIFKGRLTLLVKNMGYMLLNLYLNAANKVWVSSTVDGNSSAGKMPYAIAISAGTMLTVYIDCQGKIF